MKSWRGCWKRQGGGEGGWGEGGRRSLEATTACGGEEERRWEGREEQDRMRHAKSLHKMVALTVGDLTFAE